MTEYEELKKDYAETFDMDDPVTAFGLMKRASALCEFLEPQANKYTRLAFEAEKQAVCTEAKVSSANGKSVAEGKRFAEQDSTVLAAWKEYAVAVETASNYAAQARHALRIYYDTKKVYDNGEKKERYNG